MARTGLTGDELKARAVDVAGGRIRLVGYDKFRLSDVARDMGISHAALYAHFADKAALLDAVTEQWVSEVGREVGGMVSSADEPGDRIIEWFVRLYRMKRAKALDDPELHRAFGVAAELNKSFVTAHLLSLFDQLSALLTEAGSKNPNEDARLMYKATAAFHHPVLVARAAQNDDEAELRHIVKIIWLGMQSSSGAS